MNVITIAGQLGRDAEMRYLPNGDPVCSFSVADSAGKDKTTIWWSCSLFGKRAEALSQYLTKGQAVTVGGTITQREYTDKDGVAKKSMDVRVNEIALQGGKREAQEEKPQRQERQQRQAPQQRPSAGFEDLDDSIPF